MGPTTSTDPAVVPESPVEVEHRALVLSQVLVWGSTTLLLVLAASFLVLAYRYRRRYRLAHAMRQPGATGPVIVAGTVSAPAGTAVIKVVITQTSRFMLDPGYHDWREVERVVLSTPFDLVAPGGEVIRVEPGQRVELIAPLVVDPREPLIVLESRRTCESAVMPGQWVMIAGTLSRMNLGGQALGAFRSGATSPVLRPAEDAPLRVVVKEDAHDRFYALCAGACVLQVTWVTVLLFAPVVRASPHSLSPEAASFGFTAQLLFVFVLAVVAKVRRPAPWYTRRLVRDLVSPR
jgi:hypothetical protein